MIDIKVFCDTLHTQIRGLLISYAGKKENLLNKKRFIRDYILFYPNDIDTVN